MWHVGSGVGLVTSDPAQNYCAQTAAVSKARWVEGCASSTGLGTQDPQSSSLT